MPRLRFKDYHDTWNVIKLGDIIKWKRGKSLAKKALNTDKSGNPVVHYADLYKFAPVQNHVIHWSTTDEGVPIPTNSLLFPMSDVTPTGLATTTVLTQSGVKASGDTLIGTIKPNFDARFISFSLNAHPHKILRMVTGTTVRHINAKSLSLIQLNVPELAEQQRIADFFVHMEHERAFKQKELKLLGQLEHGYAQRML